MRNHSFLLSKPTPPNITNPLGAPFLSFMLITTHAFPLSLPPCSFPSSISRFIHEAMRDRRMDRFIVLPFSIGCVSQSSVAVIENQPKKGQAEAAAASTQPSCGDAQRQGSGKRIMNISAGFQKLIKSFKNLSQLFVMYDEEEDNDSQIEMEIGFPTDVQHIGHIGWDGFNNTNSVKSWDKAPEFLPLPSFSLKQLELAMAAQAGAPPAPVVPLGAFRRREV